MAEQIKEGHNASQENPFLEQFPRMTTQNILLVSLRIVLHLIPVTMTFYVLSLSSRKVYLQGQNDYDILPLFQIVSKAHEFLITFSMSDIALFYIRNGLESDAGVGFGLLGAMYTAAAGGCSFLWYPLRLSWGYRYGSRRIPWLLGLLLVTSFLGLAANPSASILIVPRLNWWLVGDAFYLLASVDRPKSLSQLGWTMFLPKIMYPRVFTNDTLSSEDTWRGTLGSISEKNNTGFENLADVLFQTSLDNYNAYGIYQVMNSTLPADDATVGSGRQITSYINANQVLSIPGISMDTPATAYSSCSNTSIIQGYLTTLLNTAAQTSLNGIQDSPWKVQAKVNDGDPQVPYTVSWCQTSEIFRLKPDLSMEFKTSGVNPFTANQIAFELAWNNSLTQYRNSTFFEWVELPQTPDFIGSIFFSRKDDSTTSPAVSSVCATQAYWIPTSMWNFPTQSSAMNANFTYANSTSNGYGNCDQCEQIFCHIVF